MNTIKSLSNYKPHDQAMRKSVYIYVTFVLDVHRIHFKIRLLKKILLLVILKINCNEIMTQ